MNPLISSEDPTTSTHRLQSLLEAYTEWHCIEERTGRLINLCRDDWELKLSHGRLMLQYCGDKGIQIWQVIRWEWNGTKLIIDASKRMGAERAKLELIPRTPYVETVAIALAARRAAAFRLAELICKSIPNSKIDRVSLSHTARGGATGPYARILLNHKNGFRVAATGTVDQSAEPRVDSFISSALIWFHSLQKRSKKEGSNLVKRFVLLLPEAIKESVLNFIGLLRLDLQNSIDLYTINSDGSLSSLSKPSWDQLFKESENFKYSKYSMPHFEITEQLVNLAPDAIDVIRSRGGETLRFYGLPFARVRRVMKVERCWFGIETKQILNDSNWSELLKLIEDLKSYRKAEATDKEHAFYRINREAWLESIINRNINRLDAGLVSSPIHPQFRTSNETGTRPVDLLAIREDGRLVLIELKVAEDRDLIVQAVNYWRCVESLRRTGALNRVKLFGNRRVRDVPPIIYLVAPILRFHRDQSIIAQTINPAIEIYRLGINEDWREGIKVVRRERLKI
jgi:hypothetical protein